MAILNCSKRSLFGRSELCSLVTLLVERLLSQESTDRPVCFDGVIGSWIPVLSVDLLHVRDFMSNDLDRFCEPYIMKVLLYQIISINLPRDGVVRILLISVSCIRGVVGFDFE